MGDAFPAFIGLLIGLLIGSIFGFSLWRRQRAVAAGELASALGAERAKLIEEARRAAEAQATQSIARQREQAEAGVAAERALIATREGQLAAQQTALRTQREEAAEHEARLERREAKTTLRDEALAQREQVLDRKLEAFDRQDTKLREREASLDERIAGLDQRAAMIAGHEKLAEDQLGEIAKMSRDQAKEELLRRLDAQLVEEQVTRIAKHEKDVVARSKEIGIELIGRAIQRYAAEHTAETTITKVRIADEDMKGRIIGKDGRNIKAFEQATGVDLIIDETPGTITISCFSGLRREIARRTLEALIADGRIQPARIEEVLAKIQQDLDREVVKLGEDAAYSCDVSGLHPQLIKLLGKLQYRTSYGQNVLKHTQEVAYLCGSMAADMGLDPKLGRRCGLLHDIGKAIDHEQEGSHPELGYEALKRYGETEIVANAALAHHEGREVLSAYTTLAAAADAISAARPGARSENTERYIKRLEQLEDIACSFKGVQKAYAIQAGRELRVIVNNHHLQDAELGKVARDIARRIEDEVAFPGEVKVTIIRETRHIAVAR